MALIIADRVKETSTSIGTGAFTLAGAQANFIPFSDKCSVADTCYYCIQHMALGEWEVGLGTYSALNTLTRTTVLASSNGGSAVVFSGGTKDVFLTSAAAWLLAPQVNSITTPIVKPAADSTTAVQITKADGTTAIINVDTTNKRVGFNITPLTGVHLYGTAGAATQLLLQREQTTGTGGGGVLLYHNNASLALPNSGDRLGYFFFGGYDGATGRNGAGISAVADGTWVANTAQPTAFLFETTSVGSLIRTERMRIDNAGNVGINTTAPTSRLHVVGLPVYANNAAALGGGLTAGAFYRTGGDPDQVCVVH